MAYSSPPYTLEASSMRRSSSVRPLCDSQYREAAIRAVNQAKKQFANSSLEAELARLHHEYKSKQVKLQESYLAAKAHANISIVSSLVTLPSTSSVVFPTRSRQFYNSVHSQDPMAAPSASPMSNCLSPASHYPVPPSHQKSCVSLLPPHIAQQSRAVHGNPQMQHPPSTPTLQGISRIQSTSCFSQGSFYPSQGFSTVYPNVPMSQGYPNSQFPFSQPLSDSVDIPPHLTTSCLPNPVHVDTSVPPPSFPPTHNLDFNLPMPHKMTNPTNPHCKLSELFPSNISKELLYSTGFGYVWEQQTVNNAGSTDTRRTLTSGTILNSHVR